MNILDSRRKQVVALNIAHDAKIFKLKPESDIWIQDALEKDVIFVKKRVHLFIYRPEPKC